MCNLAVKSQENEVSKTCRVGNCKTKEAGQVGEESRSGSKAREERKGSQKVTTRAPSESSGALVSWHTPCVCVTTHPTAQHPQMLVRATWPAKRHSPPSPCVLSIRKEKQRVIGGRYILAPQMLRPIKSDATGSQSSYPHLASLPMPFHGTPPVCHPLFSFVAHAKGQGCALKNGGRMKIKDVSPSSV